MEEEKKPTPKISHSKKSFTEKARSNPWMISTTVLAVFALILIVGNFSGFGMTGNVISEKNLEESFLNFASSQVSDIEVLDIKEENGLYKITFTSPQTGDSEVYVTLDGENLVNGLIPLTALQPQEDDIPQEDLIPISECVESYGINESTVIFYYSDSCGWCARMKPGVEALEEQGYEFKWIEANDANSSEIVTNCIRDYMTSGGIPQFICPKTNEIHVGAFADSEGNLNSEAMKEWVDNCISE